MQSLIRPPGTVRSALAADQQVRDRAQRLSRRVAVEVSTNHAAVVSHPDEVLQLNETAAEAVSR
jgi:hypothetical protein